MKTFLTSLVFFIATIILGQNVLFAQNWTRLYGVDGQCRAEAGLGDAPITWSETENIAWKIDVPGKAWSSPVVYGNQIWLTNATEDGKERSALCFDTETGEKLHDILVFHLDKPEYTNPENSYASATPVIEENRLYVHYGIAGTAAIDTNTGEKLWERTDLYCDPLRGYGASPILYKDLIILTFDGTDVQFIIALDKNTGKTVWKTDRSTDFTNVEPNFRKGYCTPAVFRHKGKDYLVSSSSQASYAYEPDTGKEIWRYEYPGWETSIMTPRIYKDTVLVNTAFPKPVLFSLKIESEGVIPKDDYVWTYNGNLSAVNSPVLVDNHYYFNDGNGVIF
ncbi:MAG: PQQ-binding-like beta-propeller repeat protein, partial [Thermoguttaceae bacterium]